jgi:hypothetical protein
MQHHLCLNYLLCPFWHTVQTTKEGATDGKEKKGSSITLQLSCPSDGLSVGQSD